MSPFLAQIERDLMIAWQNRQDLGVMLIFFVIIIALFPLAIGANSAILDPLGIPVVWIAALLAILAGFDRLFAQDVRDGWLDQVSLSPLGLGWYALAKAISHWLTAGLPLLIMTPVMAIMLNIPTIQWPPLLIALLIGSMGLTLLGVIGAALAEGARRGGA
ncbi:MAG: heme exporter protein CcmB, partial [Alphaproteobacteria bacterium]|nr:heme exporter protein CcmB [Alphaproteobacteria bacterium]